MFDLTEAYSFSNEPMATYLNTKPNIRTGEGRMKIRGANKLGDQKKKAHRKMAKKSRRANRR
jgi:hypothetical protein